MSEETTVTESETVETMNNNITLTKADLHFVMSRCPEDIRELLGKYPGKIMVAGGFIRSIIAGEKVSDIDLLGADADAMLLMAKDLTLERKGRYFTTKNAATVLAAPRIPVQFITRWVFDSPEKCIESFDFTVCQAAIWAKNTDDNHLTFASAISTAFYPDLAARRLTYTVPERLEDVGGSLLRVIKYVKRGYDIQAASLAKIVARLMSGVDKRRLDETVGECDEQWVSTVLTGLLREVDPLIVIDGVDFVDEHETLTSLEEEE